MRVFEVAQEFKIGAEQLMTLLRGMGVQVRSEASPVEDSVVSRLRARMERERRLGHADESEALEAVLEDAQVAGKRRRRKKEDLPPAPELAEAETTADV